MIRRPLVSIIIPIYNVEKYLEECFASVVNQTYKNIEIILVDDGSTDDSGKIADKLAEGNVRATVIHKKNGGLSDARNVGMRTARGEYITFIDSDDYVDKEFVRVLVDAATESDADIAQCDNSRRIKDMGNGSGKLTILSGQDAFVSMMKFKSISPPAWGKLYKKSLFDNSGLTFPVGRIHEDTAILYKLIYFANKIACIDTRLYYYRLNNNSIMTARYTNKHYDSVLAYHDELDKFVKLNRIDINRSVIYRHKALRFLSVLNKLALNRMEQTIDYTDIRKAYVTLAVKSYDAVCLAGILLVYIPNTMRSINGATPHIRKLLGKM